MTSRVEIDLPGGHGTLSLGELSGFVEHARQAGATRETPVIAVPAVQDESILVALRVEIDEFASQPVDLRVDRDEVKHLLDLLAEIDANDGDARSHLPVVRALRQRLTHIALQT